MTTLHLITHTHWDREWYLTYQQFRLKLVHLMDNLLIVLDNDPDFKHFMLDGQTIMLDDYLQMRPEKFAAIREYVQNGRLIIGPWYILPDEFLVSPESIIRNLLHGDHSTKRFGKKMLVGYSPDPFGHIGQMPQILQGFGIETACLMRGLSDESCELWWQSPDGSRVLLSFLRDGYGNGALLPANNLDQFTKDIEQLRDSLLPYSKSGHLLVMHGTDHTEPPPNTSTAIGYAKQRLGEDILLHSTLSEYFLSLKSAAFDLEAIPTIIGELRSPKRFPLLPNVLSTRMWIKQRNHTCETLLEKWAEPFSLWAEAIQAEKWRDTGESSGSMIGYAQDTRINNPAALIRQAWRLLMECHPHDSICGCSIDQVCVEMKTRFDQVEQLSGEIIKQSLDRIAGVIDTTNKHDPAVLQGVSESESKSNKNPKSVITNPNKLISSIIVFNPIAESRTDYVTVVAELPFGEFDLLDDHGNAIPYETSNQVDRELINVSFDKKMLEAGLRMIADGKAMGKVVQQVNFRREGETLYIEGFMSDNGPIDSKKWGKTRQEIETYMIDASIQKYVVQINSVPASSFTFIAPEIPGFGFRTFYLAQRPGPANRASPIKVGRFMSSLLAFVAKLPLINNIKSPVRVDHVKKTSQYYQIDNDYFRIEASQKTGVLSILDKISGITYRDGNRFIDGGDCGDEYNYCPPVNDITLQNPDIQEIRVISGKIRQTMEISMKMMVPVELNQDRQSRSAKQIPLSIKSTVTIISGVPRIDIQTEIENKSHDHRLRVHFPVPFQVDDASFDGHFEIVRRSLGLPAFDDSWVEQPCPEQPQCAFTSVSNGDRQFTLANRGLPEVEVFRSSEGNTEIALTLLRCVGHLSSDDFVTRKGHAGPPIDTPGAQMEGKYTFDYSIILNNARNAEMAYHQAYAFNAPLRAISTGLHAGELKSSSSLVAVTSECVDQQSSGSKSALINPWFMISAIKTAEDDNGFIVRGYNLSDHPIRVTLQPWKSFIHVNRTNLIEESVEVFDTGNDGKVHFIANHNEIISVRFAD